MGVKSQVRTRTPTYYLDFTLSPGATHFQEIPEDWTTFVYTLKGKVKVGEGVHVDAHHTVVFTKNGEGVLIENVDEDEAQLVLVSGKPLG